MDEDEEDIEQRVWRQDELVLLYGEALRKRALGGDEQYSAFLTAGESRHVYGTVNERRAHTAENDQTVWKSQLLRPFTHLRLLAVGDELDEVQYLPDQSSINNRQVVVNCIASALHQTLDINGLPDGQTPPVADLKRIDVVPCEEGKIDCASIEEYETRTNRLHFQAPADGLAPKLKCITLGSPKSVLPSLLRELVRPDHQRTFTIHLDTATVGIDMGRVLRDVPLPKRLQHLVITFSPQHRFLTERVPAGSRNPLKNDAIQRVLHTISWLQAQRRPPILVKVKGMYSAFEADWWDHVDLVGEDGIFRTQAVDMDSSDEEKYQSDVLWPIKDHSADLLRRSFTRRAIRQNTFDDLDAAIDYLTYAPDDEVPPNMDGLLRIMYSHIDESSTCADCDLALCAKTPTAFGSTIPPEYANHGRYGSAVRVYFCGRW
jgi:hypothetical protein